NPAPMEPLCIPENGLPVDSAHFDLGHGTVGPIINYLTSAHAGPRFQKIDAQAVPPEDNMVRSHTGPSNFLQCGFPDIVYGQTGYKSGIHTVIGHGNRYIKFPAPIAGGKIGSLRDPEMPFGRKS